MNPGADSASAFLNGHLDAVEVLRRVTESIPGGVERPSQVEMTEAVAKALRTGSHLAVQGPTGVGKSLAYLCAALEVVGKGERVVVVTSSKALQDQLSDVDLPLLAAASPLPFTYAVLKGRSNYLCAAAVAEVEVQLGDGPRQESLDLGADVSDELDEELAEELTELLVWADATASGDMAELPTTPSPKAWSAVSVAAGECVGASNCAYSQECLSEAARAQAAEADIVVVNAHLYSAHVESNGALLPEHSALIIDEAHEFEDAVVGALAIEMTEGRLLNLARVHDRSVADDQKVSTALRAAARAMHRALGAEAGDGSHRLVEGPGKELSAALATAVSAADRALNGLRRAAKAAGDSNARHRIDRGVKVAEAVLDDAQSLLGELDPGSVCWIETGVGDRHAVRLTRIDVGATLAMRAWSGEEPLTVICCSATLDKGTPGRLGLRSDFLAVDSPFDFSKQAVLYVPKVRSPKHPEWPTDVADVIEFLIEALDGRTLALFTSHRMLRATVDECRERMPKRRLLAQGDAPNPVLLQQFLDEEHTCLFATASFWTGVSSPGTTCSAVVVDKIPFPVPTDPIVEARCEVVGDRYAFSQVSLPAAGMQLAQGVGRLIRTSQDRGVVAVCDPRLAEAGYRTQLLDLLPPMRRARNKEWVASFIEELDLPAS